MARFQYDKLNEKQLRIAIALLNQEDEVVSVLEITAAQRINDVLSAFDIDIATSVNSGAPGGARAQTTKSSNGPVTSFGSRDGALIVSRKPARRVQRPGHVKGATVSSGQLASRQLQGQYIAAVRRVPKTKRKSYKAGPDCSREQAIERIDRDYPKKDK